MKKKTIELFDRLSDDQKSTAAALGRVANLLERVLPDRTTSASDQVPEANRSGNTGPTVKSIEVIVGPPGQTKAAAAAEQSLEDGEIQQADNSQNSPNNETLVFQRGFGFTSSTPHHKVTNKVTSEAPERENRDDVTKSSIVDRISGAILQNLEKSLNTDCRINSSGLSGNNSISIDLNHSETNVYRRYVLTKKMKYETFENFLHTELKAKRLFYALDPKERSKVETIKLTNDDVKIKDIIINHIHENYNEKLSHMNNPIDLLDEIKRIKTQEIGLTKHIANQ